jgi:hypothetical protein
VQIPKIAKKFAIETVQKNPANAGEKRSKICVTQSLDIEGLKCFSAERMSLNVVSLCRKSVLYIFLL